MRADGFLYTLESGNPEAAPAISARFFLRKRRKEIPAFAGMTKYYIGLLSFTSEILELSSRHIESRPIFHTLFRGNDEVLFGGIVFTMPIPRRPVRHEESRPISSHARKRELPMQGSEFSQFRHVLSYSDGGFGNAVKHRECDPAAGETGYA